MSPTPGKRRRIAWPLGTGLLLCAAASLVPLLFAQKAWPPITAEESALKDCSQIPGAGAIFLFREEIADIKAGETRVFKRLKVLTAAGRDRANVEIMYVKGLYKVVDLEARVVPPEGVPRPFTGQVFDKTALLGPGIRVAVKTFALPDVTPGAIIEYRYKLVVDTSVVKGDAEDILDALPTGRGKPPEGDIGKGMKLLSLPVERWDIEEGLFTRKARFVYVPGDSWGFILSLLFDGRPSLLWFSKRIPDTHPVWNKDRLELEVENIPPFEAEELMPPESSEKMCVNLFYFDSKFKDPKAYWTMECKNWQKAAEAFLGRPHKLAAACGEIVGDETDPARVLMRLYERVQQIRNLSYEQDLTSRRRKEQKIKDNRNAADVLERGYGYRSDITRTFVALARAAGFEAEVVRVSTRDDKLFHNAFLSFTGQLDSEAALVPVGDKTLLFDPATPFCPFGLVHWTRSNAAAVRFSEKPPAFFTTPVYPPELGLTQRVAALRLDARGSLSGTIEATYMGHEALIRRLDHIHDDAEEVRRSLEEEMMELLPEGSEAKMTKLENIDNNAPALIARFDVVLPGLAVETGDRMLLPASPLLGKRQHPFRHAERKYPAYFPYPFREFNDIVITLPDGMTVETCPPPQKAQDEFCSYSLLAMQEGPLKLHVQRDLIVHKSFFSVEQYPALKSFYDAVRTGDTEQFVLRALAVVDY